MDSSRLTAASNVAGPIAHDMANLLSVMLPTLEMLRSDMPESDENRPLADAAFAAGVSVAALSRQLVDLVRGAVGARAVAPVAELRAAAGLVSRSTPDQVRVITDIPATLPRVWSAPGSLTQAVVNLVLNAKDAIGARQGTIRVEAAVEASGLAVRVVDDGPGMPPELLARIGRPFVTTKGEKGTGLGLFMVRSVIERDGGEFRIDSKPGRGTVVTLHLPLAGNEGPIASYPRGHFGQGWRAIFAEANESLAVLLDRLLRSAGFDARRIHSQHEIPLLMQESGQQPTVGIVGDSPNAVRPVSEILSAMHDARCRRVIWVSATPMPSTTSHIPALLVEKPFAATDFLSAMARAVA